MKNIASGDNKISTEKHFSMWSEVDIDKRNSAKYKQQNMKKENAEKLLNRNGYFGGQRFLGINKNGREVWITFKAYEDRIEVKTTEDMFNVMPENGGEYSDSRVKLWINEDRPKELTTYVKIDHNTKKAKSGRVAETTLLHLDKIINELDTFTTAGKKPPRTLYRLLAWNIYSGTWGSANIPDTNWDDCADLQGYKDPEGYFFTGQI